MPILQRNQQRQPVLLGAPRIVVLHTRPVRTPVALFLHIAGLVGIEIPLIPTIKTAEDLTARVTQPRFDASVTSEEVFAPPAGGSIVSNAITTSKSQTVNVDRSIRDLRFEIHASGQDTKSIKEQLLEVFAELAAQGDGIEGVIVDA